MAKFADGKIEAYLGPQELGAADKLEDIIVEFIRAARVSLSVAVQEQSRERFSNIGQGNLASRADKVSALVTFTSDGSYTEGTAVAMNTKLVALVLIVALVATGTGTGLAVLLSR